MDLCIRLLVSCNFFCYLNRLRLRFCHFGCLIVTFTLNSPAVLVWHYMLIFTFRQNHTSISLGYEYPSAIKLVGQLALLSKARPAY